MTDREIENLMGNMPQEPPPALIETHISWVVLAGDRVWKIKKPMQYAFLDFSSLAAREKYCRRELELNRRQAPEMYLGLARVCRDGDRFQVADDCDEAELVDFAVKMKRMDEASRLDRLVDAGGISAERGAELAMQVAEFHRKASVISDPGSANVAGYRSDFADIKSVRDDFVRHLGTDAGNRLDRITAESLDWLDLHGELLERRLSAGWVRDLHGDLHTRNIFAGETAFVIFDCIEFNDAFRQIDVLSEVAFLYMDVGVKGRIEFGNSFLKAYLDEIPAIANDEDKALFNYFRRYRANVRAKVNALRARQAIGEELEKAVEEMRIYLDLMEKTAISASIPLQQ